MISCFADTNLNAVHHLGVCIFPSLFYAQYLLRIYLCIYFTRINSRKNIIRRNLSLYLHLQLYALCSARPFEGMISFLPSVFPWCSFCTLRCTCLLDGELKAAMRLQGLAEGSCFKALWLNEAAATHCSWKRVRFLMLTSKQWAWMILSLSKWL